MLRLIVLALYALEVCSQQNQSVPAEFYLDTRAFSRKLNPASIGNNNARRNADVTDRFYTHGKLQLKFIIHGWTEDANRTHYINMAKVFLKHGDCNIIRVDYSNVASQNYLVASMLVRKVGNYVADFILKLMKQYDIPMENVHVIGHSMGGQVSGYVGRRMFEVSGQKLHRISALDPASPIFELLPDQLRLTSKDANIVDIVHTDAGGFGYAGELGTVDFFPNGGTRMQPGCYASEESGSSSTSDSEEFCSHHKSYIYFTISILRNIWATRCKSWKDFRNGDCDQHEQILFGARMPENATGSYYFEMDVDDDYISDILLSQPQH